MSRGPPRNFYLNFKTTTYSSIMQTRSC
uniref:Uncharacterized protein n=1 Tax=Anguilla anguilla TaxID=7936 RepID=A0A0E9WGF0_ANGAN